MHRSRYQQLEKEVSAGLAAELPEHRISRFMFMSGVLRLLSEGAFVYRAVAFTLRSLIGVLILAALAVFFTAGKVIFGLSATGAIAGGILYQLCYVISIYAVVHVLLIRSRDIALEKPGTVFMLPLGAMLVRMVGEAYAAFVAFISLGSAIFTWFTGQKASVILGPLGYLFPIMTDASFLGGIGFIFAGVMLSLAAIIGSYMLSELMLIASRSGAHSAKLAALPKPASVAPVPTASRPPRSRSRFNS